MEQFLYKLVKCVPQMDFVLNVALNRFNYQSCGSFKCWTMCTSLYTANVWKGSKNRQCHRWIHEPVLLDCL